MSASNIIIDAESTESLGGKESLREVLDFLVTEEQLGVTLVSAAIKNAPGTPSEAFLPVLRNGVTTEYHLHKVFTKLEISSRNELQRVLPSEARKAQPV